MRCIVLIQSGFTHLNHVFTNVLLYGAICVKSMIYTPSHVYIKKKQPHLLQIIRLDLIQCPQY